MTQDNAGKRAIADTTIATARICAMAAVWFCVALFSAMPALAQETSASISGQVYDRAGKGVPGARVTITHIPSGTKIATTADPEGGFGASGLRVGGPFTVEAEAQGFEPGKESDIFVSLGEPFSVTLQLKGGLASLQEVVVSSSRERSVPIGVVTQFSADDIGVLPSIRNDVKDILRLDPKIVLDPANQKSMEIAGTNGRYNSITVDGIRQSDDFGLSNSGYPSLRAPISLDAIEAVSVLTAPFDVQYSFFQGGTINIVTKSGSNDFHGTVSYAKSGDGLSGKRTGTQPIKLSFSEDGYSAALRGPIIQDKLFFSASFSKVKRLAPVDTGPSGAGFPISVAQVPLAEYQRIVDIAKTVYNFTDGEIGSELPEADRKIHVKLDWNINDNHRASLSYQNNAANQIIQNSTNTNSATGRFAAPSNWYDLSAPLKQYAFNVYSKWSDRFSTDLKLGRKESVTNQVSLRGIDFAEMQITTSLGGVVFIGPDEFRHANFLSNTLNQARLKGDYRFGAHTITGGLEYEQLDVFNLFVARSQGQYIFSAPMGQAITDFQNRLANTFSYTNAVSNNANDGAGAFGVDTLTFYLQDKWQVSQEFSFTAGLRLDKYSTPDVPNLNQNFVTRYGFTNTDTLDGRSIVSPRLGFNWSFDDRTTIRGGIGLFGGGSPNVWISNSFANDGVTVVNQTINRPTNRPLTALETAALNNFNGFDIPAAVLANQSTLRGDGPVNAVDPGFKIPSSWRADIGFDRRFNIPFFGDDYRITADVLYTTVKNAAIWRDINLVRIGNAPDGRPIYSRPTAPPPGTTLAPRNQSDYLLTNTTQGKGTVITMNLSKTWRTAAGRFDMSVGAAYQDVKDVNSGTSSTASSNWDNLATENPNNPSLATSNYEMRNRFPVQFTWRKAFFGDYITSAGLFAERRSGKPYSLTFASATTAFGDPRQAARQRQLFYVPLNASDMTVDATSITAAQMDAFVTQFGLERFRGQIIPRNAFKSPWATIADLRVSQEVPGFFKGAKGIISFDIENVANLINKDWGQFRQIVFPFVSPVANATIVNGKYRYAAIGGQTTLRSPTTVISPADQSVWRMQLGVRFEF